MALPAQYRWTHSKGFRVSGSSPSKYNYSITLKNMYAEVISKIDVVMFEPNNLSDEPKNLAQITGLNLSYYGRSGFTTRPDPVSSATYDKVYVGNNATFSPSYYNSKTYNGKSLGTYLSSVKTYEYGTSGTKGDEYLYYYSNGIVSVYDIARLAEFTINDSRVDIGYVPTTGHEVYIKKDTRIPTNCCILYLCKPTIYKKA